MGGNEGMIDNFVFSQRKKRLNIRYGAQKKLLSSTEENNFSFILIQLKDVVCSPALMLCDDVIQPGLVGTEEDEIFQ